MLSMLWKRGIRQEVPDRKTGMVVGIDVSKGKIDFGGYRPEGGTATSQVGQDRAGFEKLKGFIEEFQCSGYQVWVGFEPTGPYSSCLREWLLSSAYRTVQVNPYHVKRTKEVRDNSPHKSDQKDPGVIADLIWQGCYQELYQLGPVYAELRSASADWKSSNRERTAMRNAFQGLLEVWFPELTSFFQDRVCKTVRALVRNYCSAEALGRASLRKIKSIVRKASGGKVGPEKAQAIWRAGRDSIAPPHGQEMRHRHMCRLLDQLQYLEDYREQLCRRMEDLLTELPEAACLLSVVGIGTITVACLLGQCGDLGRYPSYQQAEKFVGLNLYQVSSGRHQGDRHISKRGRSLARGALCQAAVGQMKKSGLYYGYRQRQQLKKQPSGKIRVAIARKLLELLYALARDRAMFDPGKFFTESKAGDGPVILQGAQRKVAA